MKFSYTDYLNKLYLRDINSRAEVVVMGDLDKEDARQLWEEYLHKYLSLSFKDTYDVFGGHVPPP